MPCIIQYQGVILGRSGNACISILPSACIPDGHAKFLLSSDRVRVFLPYSLVRFSCSDNSLLDAVRRYACGFDLDVFAVTIHEYIFSYSVERVFPDYSFRVERGIVKFL